MRLSKNHNLSIEHIKKVQLLFKYLLHITKINFCTIDGKIVSTYIIINFLRYEHFFSNHKCSILLEAQFD